MQITDVRVRKLSEEGKMRGIVSVTFDNAFVVHDIKIIEGQNGLFIVQMQTIISLIMLWICGNLQAPMKRRLCINIRLVVVT